MAVCDASIYSYCNYASGQTSYDTPYSPGVSCSGCPPGWCFNNLCVCTKFCQNQGVLSDFNYLIKIKKSYISLKCFLMIKI